MTTLQKDLSASFLRITQGLYIIKIELDSFSKMVSGYPIHKSLVREMKNTSNTIDRSINEFKRLMPNSAKIIDSHADISSEKLFLIASISDKLFKCDETALTAIEEVLNQSIVEI